MKGRICVNQGQDDEMEITGYARNTIKTGVIWFFIVITVGLLRLFFYWLPHLMIRAMYSKCSLDQAEVVILKDEYKQWFVSDVKMITRDGKKGIEEDVTVNYFHDTSCLSFMDVTRRRVLYGLNSVDIHVTPIIKLLFKEVLSPFYIFQLFSCSLWYADEYEYYASCIVLISVLSITATIYQTRKMQRALRNTVQSSTIVSVIRNGNESMDISSEDLVPGDVIEIPRNGCLMQCDAVLITGSCIVNESMLTGESVPVTKTPIPNPRLTHEDSRMMFRPKDHGRHILFCGTHVIQTRFYGGHKVKAVVFRTGFSTAKGELVRSILYPKPVDFRFNRDTYKFVNRGDAAGDIALRALDLITIAVPPALPAALTVGIVFAQSRLKTARIYCISPRSINVCGGINTVCFDKTGTLTEDGLDMHSVVPVNDEKFEPGITHLNLLPRGKFMTGMATCHSLTIIDGVLSGDPLELIMFESIGWELKEPTMEEGSNFDMICPTIVYPKSSSLVQSADLTSGNVRMSVIVRRLGAEHFEIFTKGAPEMIASLCVTDTVPDDFHDILMSYTRRGFRVLALAYKPLPEKLKYPKLQRIEREQVERGLTFLGLIVMENRLKPETTPVIRDLKDANIRPIMVTGDNMLTALSVARECFFAEENEQIILVQVFPAQYDAKGDVMEQAHVEYVYTDPQTDKQTNRIPKEKQIDTVLPMAIGDAELGTGKKYHFAVTGNYYVGMCGDGANDCGALKTAHAGISLSEAEASVASPFTSKTPNISCVPTTIREGRAALVTSFGIFKYMACYSLTQFVSVLLLYWVGVNLTDYEFLYIDLFLLTTLIGRTHAYHRLHKVAPLVRLTSLAPVLSLILQMTIIIAVQVFFYFIIKREPWYIEYVDDPEEDYDYMSYENTAVYISSSYQYIILAIVFSKGKPYRKSMFTNYVFMINLFICIGITAWISIYPTDPVAEFFEEFILDSHYVSVTLQSKLDKCFPGSKLKYETVEEDLQMASAWPPVKSEDLAGTFARMDSAFLSSKTSLNEQDSYSLSESETGSQNEYDQEICPNASPNDIKLNGVSNAAFQLDERYSNGKLSTKL
ncbi:AT133-like protein [Mya arenaria]|uniref:Cation-transporting ATPase n=1 Tax=Mya arenaria TaxID=6604 RepID=A0ABY7F412_MYAAR|nr:AT133-like protein [Mya arenaria]